MSDTNHDHGRSRYLAAAIALAVVAGACGGEDAAEEVIEGRIEAETGDDVDIDLDDGEIRIETDEGEIRVDTDDGNVSIEGEGTDGEISVDADDGRAVIESDEGTMIIDESGAEVPDDFPASVPLPDGFAPQFSQSMSMPEGDSWTLGGAIAGDPGDVADAYIAQLETAGFEQLQVTESPDAVIFVYDDGELTVTGAAGPGDEGATFLNLSVTPSQT